MALDNILQNKAKENISRQINMISNKEAFRI